MQENIKHIFLNYSDNLLLLFHKQDILPTKWVQSNEMRLVRCNFHKQKLGTYISRRGEEGNVKELCKYLYLKQDVKLL